MKSNFKMTLAVVIPVMALPAMTGAALAGSMAHAHMGHVAKGWKDTPNKMGLLPTAVAEARIAAQHAGFAASKTDDLKWMKLHTHHVLHALDASLEAKGPGLGYGVLKAASGAMKHINFAAGSKDASKNVKTHAVHVAASAGNTVERAKALVALGRKILAAKTAAQAAPMVKKMAMLAGQLQTGVDANADGKITWHKGEGGLNAAVKHLGIMYKLEGLK